MKSFAATALFVSGALAARNCGSADGYPAIDTVPADVLKIAQALVAINTTTLELDNAINGYQGAAQVDSLKAESAKLISLIQDQTTIVSGIAPLQESNQFDAANVAGYVTSLGCTVTIAINDLIAKKALFASTCEGPTVLQQVQAQLAAAQKFADTTIAKIPAGGVHDLALNLTANITTELQDGVNAFQGVTLPASCGASTGTTAPGTVAPTATSSAVSGQETTCDETATVTTPVYSAPTATTECDESSVTTPAYSVPTVTSECDETTSAAWATSVSYVVPTSAPYTAPTGTGGSAPAYSAPAYVPPAVTTPVPAAAGAANVVVSTFGALFAVFAGVAMI